MDYKSLWKIIYLGEDRQTENVLYLRAESKTVAVNMFISEVGMGNFICDAFIADEDEVAAYEQGFAAGGDWEYQKAYEHGRAILTQVMLDILDQTKLPWRRKAIIHMIERISKTNE
jgi:hypothetical protein